MKKLWKEFESCAMPRLYRAEQHNTKGADEPPRCAMPRLYRAEQHLRFLGFQMPPLCNAPSISG